VASSTVSLRLRNGEQVSSLSLENFKKTLRRAIANKEKDLKL